VLPSLPSRVDHEGANRHYRYLSSTALLLFTSYQIHNFVSYLKIRLFLPRWGRRTFIVTLICIQPYWVLETVSNFEFWNGTLRIWPYTRPLEPLAREPWWIFTTCFLIYQIKSKYQLSAGALLQISPRFSIMVLCMFLSIAFLVADAIVTIRNLSAEEGVNPFWRVRNSPLSQHLSASQLTRRTDLAGLQSCRRYRLPRRFQECARQDHGAAGRIWGLCWAHRTVQACPHVDDCAPASQRRATGATAQRG
jgi:hypothetical protein